MASADLREELNCSICLNVYTNPVMLRCGHNFCMDCIKSVLDSQERSGSYSCPGCREHFQERPALQINIALRNIAEHFSILPELEVGGISCTYCIYSPVPAVKTCVNCEASLCVDHLKVHVKSPEHALIEPTTFLDNRKCSVHKKILEYYCHKDAACICVSCRLDGKHQEHQVDPLSTASQKKVTLVIKHLQGLSSKKAAYETRIQSLQDHKANVEKSADDVTARVEELFNDIRRKMDVLEQIVLSEVTRQKQEISLLVIDLLRDLELEKNNLAKKILHFETLCGMSDPLNILQDQESLLVNPVKVAKHYVGDLDEGLISLPLVKGIAHIMSKIKDRIHLQPKSEILLDRESAGYQISVSDDMKIASFRRVEYMVTLTYNQFASNQVLSVMKFSSGRHYWEVETGKAGNWRIGMAYPTIPRKGDECILGN